MSLLVKPVPSLFFISPSFCGFCVLSRFFYFALLCLVLFPKKKDKPMRPIWKERERERARAKLWCAFTAQRNRGETRRENKMAKKRAGHTCTRASRALEGLPFFSSLFKAVKEPRPTSFFSFNKKALAESLSFSSCRSSWPLSFFPLKNIGRGALFLSLYRCNSRRFPPFFCSVIDTSTRSCQKCCNKDISPFFDSQQDVNRL